MTVPSLISQNRWRMFGCDLLPRKESRFATVITTHPHALCQEMLTLTYVRLHES